MSYYMHAYAYELSCLPKWVGGLGGRAFLLLQSVNSSEVLNSSVKLGDGCMSK